MQIDSQDIRVSQVATLHAEVLKFITEVSQCDLSAVGEQAYARQIQLEGELTQVATGSLVPHGGDSLLNTWIGCAAREQTCRYYQDFRAALKNLSLTLYPLKVLENAKVEIFKFRWGLITDGRAISGKSDARNLMRALTETANVDGETAGKFTECVLILALCRVYLAMTDQGAGHFPAMCCS